MSRYRKYTNGYINKFILSRGYKYSSDAIVEETIEKDTLEWVLGLRG